MKDQYNNSYYMLGFWKLMHVYIPGDNDENFKCRIYWYEETAGKGPPVIPLPAMFSSII